MNYLTDIVGQKIIHIPKTEGIKYIGSKLKLLPSIAQILQELPGNTILDGFSGTTRVSQMCAQLGYNVICNDIAVWSEVFGNCYLRAQKENRFYQEIIDHLNALPGYDGWYTEHYGATSTQYKRPFQAKNTRKLDAIRDEIERLEIDWVDTCVLLTSLIYALDTVDNTLGHYVSYLSQWSPRSYRDMRLKLPSRFPIEGTHSVLRTDIFNTVENSKYDIAYFDPPYGSNNRKMPASRVRYAGYYHIWTTIINHDKPALFGKGARRLDSNDRLAASVFEEFRKNNQGSFIATEAIRTLLHLTNSTYILLSYSSGGRVAVDDITRIVEEVGELKKFLKINYQKNVMADMRWTDEWSAPPGRHWEYLFLIQKRG